MGDKGCMKVGAGCLVIAVLVMGAIGVVLYQNKDAIMEVVGNVATVQKVVTEQFPADSVEVNVGIRNGVKTLSIELTNPDFPMDQVQEKMREMAGAVVTHAENITSFHYVEIVVSQSIQTENKSSKQSSTYKFKVSELLAEPTAEP